MNISEAGKGPPGRKEGQKEASEEKGFLILFPPVG